MVAFQHLIETHEAALLRLAGAILSDAHAAQDAVDEAFLKLAAQAALLWQTIPNGAGGWLCTVVRNRCIDTLRRARAHTALPSDPACARPDAPDLAAADDQGRLVWSEVDRLPPLERAAIVLRYRDDLPYAAIAERLGKSVSHVGVILHQAFARLRASRSLRAEVLS